MATFPKDFIWGAATSSYQIEGAAFEDGRGLSIWDTFCKTPGKVANADTGDVANDHYHRYLEDIAIMSELGIKAYRFSFAWPRMFPQGSGIKEERGFAFYDRLIDGLLEAGIEPLATLYHWDLPQALQDKGGWVNRDIVNYFAEYSTAVVERFGDRVKKFSPINEPWVVAWLGHGIGIHAPGIVDRRAAFAAAHHTVLAHAASTNAMRAVRSDLLTGPVLNQANHVADDMNDPAQAHAAAIADAHQNRFWMDAIMYGTYPQILIDNYGTPRGPLTDMGWPLTPEGLENLLVRWHKEHGDKLPPLFITENGCAYGDGPGADGAVHDPKRIDYLQTHLKAVSNAIAQGCPVKGYYQWSLMDNFEWALGYEKRFGIVHVDFDTQKRIIKDSGYWYRDQIKNNGSAI
ncbi:MAG: glycosyl hydrolase family protein [Actinobacteria bacterium]|nr:glycosyl hydrolase family protein [Actinomycetota bacterium]